MIRSAGGLNWDVLAERGRKTIFLRKKTIWFI